MDLTGEAEARRLPPSPESSAPGAPEPSLAEPALRDMVLSGRYFGAQAKDSASVLASALAAPEFTVTTWFGEMAARFRGDPEALLGVIDRDIAAIDAMMSAQVDVILHAPRLRRLEGMWRGLSWLVAGITEPTRTKVRLLAVSWAEIVRDLERAAEFDQSNLFRSVYENEFGMAGGEPFGLLVIDHELRHRPGPGAPSDDTAALASLSGVAAAAFAPTILSAAPSLLDVDDWADLAMTADPAFPLRDPAHLRWRRLATREDMRFIAVALPRLLARPPWRDDPARRDGFRYAEYAPNANCRVWMAPGYALAANAVRAHQTHGWPADLRGVDTDREGGGVVTELPIEEYSTDPPGVWPRPPLDIVFNDRQERSLIEGALIPITSLPYSPDAAFVALRSLQTPAQFNAAVTGEAGQAATANARLSSQFHAMLCVSRFAHYVKVIARDMAGSFKTADEIQRRLQSWLTKYVNTNVIAGADARARAPLLNGQVEVSEHLDRPGSFGCTILLQPHFQLEDVSATFRLTTEITSARRAA